MESAGLHGIVGGLSSVASGGSFGSGFVSAGFADLSVSGTAYFHLDNVGVAAISGGIGSVISGGKFENGAVTGAFGYIFNELAHSKEEEVPTADSINTYLKSKGSSLEGQGANFMIYGQEFDVDPRFLVVISGAETGFCGNITTDDNNEFNNLYNFKDRIKSPFDSVESSIER